MTEELSVAQEILSYCTKCKLALAHTIVTLKEPTIVHKVKCNTCKAIHVYRDPETKETQRKATKARAKKATITEIWKKALNTANKGEKSFSIRDTFEVGDIINHTKFGKGVVLSILDGDKIEVIFEEDSKLLVHSR